MLKACAYAFLIVLQLTIRDARGNSYSFGGDDDDSSAGQGVKSPHSSGSDTSISSLPQYEPAGTSDQNYWWQQNNPFQRPANHPGVQRGDSPSSRPQQPNPYQSQNKLHPTSHSRPNVFTPQPQQQPNPFGSQQPNNPYRGPQSQFNPKPNQQFQQNSPEFGSPSQPSSSPFGAPSSQPQTNFPQGVDEGCQLMNKADCHGAKGFPQRQQPPYTGYQPPPFNQPSPFKPPKEPPFSNKKPVPPPSTNYKPPSYGATEDEPLNSNSQPSDSSNQFSPSQSDIDAPSYGPITNDNNNSPSATPQSPQSNSPFNSPKNPNQNNYKQPSSTFPQPPNPQSSSPFNSPQNPQDSPFNTPKPQDSPFNSPKPQDSPFNTPKPQDSSFNSPKNPQNGSPFNSPQTPQNNDPYNSPQTPQNNDPYNSPKTPQNNDPYNSPKNPNPNNYQQQPPFSQQGPKPQNSSPFGSPNKPDQNNYQEPGAPPQNPQNSSPFNSPKSPNNYQQQQPSSSFPQVSPQEPQRPYQGPNSSPYSSPQATPPRPAGNTSPYRPNPTPQNFEYKPLQPKRPNNFIQPTNKPYNPYNQPQNNRQNFSPAGNTFAEQLPYPGCPAAMLCVPENRCNVEGVIEERSIQLSQADKIHRVALMACSHPMTGVVGVCCRDPNYKDPWPDMNNNGIPKKEHHHHPDKGNNFGGNPGNNSPLQQTPEQQSSPSFLQPNTNQRQPHQLQPQQFQPQRDQYQPQRDQYQPEKQQYQPQRQQYQPQQQQQYQSPNQQPRQPSKGFGGYPSDGKTQSNDITNVTSGALNFQECKLSESCVEISRCHNGYIRDESSVIQGTISTRIVTASKKCRADINGKSFFCCQRKPTNSIKPDLHFASTVIKESIQSAPKPIYQNNHHLQNTVAPPVSTLISGVGPLRNQEEIDLRYRISNFNPYISPDTPISPIKQHVADSHKNAPVRSPNNEVQNKTRIGISVPKHLTIVPASQIEQARANLKNNNLQHIQTRNDTSASDIRNVVDNLSHPLNVRVISKDIFQNNGSTTFTSTTEISTEVNSTSSLEEDYISSTTTTTTPKPYIHNGIPVPLSEHFKNHPPVGCIHKGPDFYLEPLKIPSKNYELPIIDFVSEDDANVTPENTTKEGITEITTTEAPTTTTTPAVNVNLSKLCPDNMTCFPESFCQKVDPKFSGKGLNRVRIQCQQPNSFRVGVCCKFGEHENSTERIKKAVDESHNTENTTYSEETCGMRRPRSSVTTDQSDTFFGEFPWQIMILNSSNDFICSGAILDRRTIITTAKCIHQINPSNIKVRVGEWNRQNNLQSEPTEDIPVQTVITHPDFDSVALKSDIALLITDRNITYDYHVGRVCLPPINENFDGRSCISTGWAASRKYGSKSSYLKQKEMLVLSQHNCQGRLQHNPTLTKRFTITKSNICARGDKQGHCESDIGDPLVCKSSTGEYQLVGLSSWSGACAQINVPGIYVNISYHTNWITTHMNRPQDSKLSSQKG